MSAIERLMNKVERDGECWVFSGAKSHRGYGLFRYTKLMSAHRVSYLLHKGEIPEGMFVLHKCDNRACVNPDHLFLGTHQDNMDDMNAKDRANNPHKKLSAESVAEIRGLLAAGAMQKSIAKQYGINQSSVSWIKTGRSW